MRPWPLSHDSCDSDCEEARLAKLIPDWIGRRRKNPQDKVPRDSNQNGYAVFSSVSRITLDPRLACSPNAEGTTLAIALLYTNEVFS
jgi:hypothetical protein